MGKAIAHALFCAADMLDSDFLSTLNPNQLLRGEPSVAAYLVVLLATIGPVTILDKAIGALAVSRDRKVLLVLLAKAAQDTFPNVAAQIIFQLPAGHAAREYLSQSKPMRPGSLDDLGDALMVSEVDNWLAVTNKA